MVLRGPSVSYRLSLTVWLIRPQDLDGLIQEQLIVMHVKFRQVGLWAGT